MQTNANSLVHDFILPGADFRSLSRPRTEATARRSQSPAISPNHDSQQQPAQLWTELETEQARHDFSHRLVYAVLAVGSLVPPLWALLAQYTTTL